MLESVEPDFDRACGVRVEAQRVEQARRRIDGHHIDAASVRGRIHCERGADSGLADAARTEAYDQLQCRQIKRLQLVRR
jgi:hypothetical protein